MKHDQAQPETTTPSLKRIAEDAFDLPPGYWGAVDVLETELAEIERRKELVRKTLEILKERANA